MPKIYVHLYDIVGMVNVLYAWAMEGDAMENWIR